ncbi:MAG TPA: hypothetical protein VGO43_16350 [Pyrinomonadaceae bacterium]|nr:hypothetical protein [Pyrinomonadaceae bacterium]
MPEKPLGRRIATHPIAPAAVQRAVFIAVLSFLFFLGMMFAFYLRQNIGYFLLGTAFLLVYLVMMYSVFTQRKSAVELHEEGLRFKRSDIRYEDVESVSEDGILRTSDGRTMTLPKSVDGFGSLLETLRDRTKSP